VGNLVRTYLPKRRHGGIQKGGLGTLAPSGASLAMTYPPIRDLSHPCNTGDTLPLI